MNKSDFIEFLESIGMIRFDDKDLYIYIEGKKENSIQQVIYLVESDVISSNLSILNIEK